MSILSFLRRKKGKNNVLSFYDIKIKGIEGEDIDLKQFKGKKIMFVNVASNCSFTVQYAGLQQLYDENKELVIIGLPCNQFGNQEPGDLGKILMFCKKSFNITFPLSEKISTKGSDQHQIYQWLTNKKHNGVRSSVVMWNFQKYLVDENGNLVNYWLSPTKPLSPKIIKFLK